MAKPSTFTQEIADEILSRLAEEPLTTILKSPGMPAYRTVMDWRRAHPDFREAYALAREDQGDYDADVVSEIREQMRRGEIAADIGRAAIDAAKWTAGKRKAKAYSDKLDISLEATVRGSVSYRARMPKRTPDA